MDEIVNSKELTRVQFHNTNLEITHCSYSICCTNTLDFQSIQLNQIRKPVTRHHVHSTVQNTVYKKTWLLKVSFKALPVAEVQLSQVQSERRRSKSHCPTGLRQSWESPWTTLFALALKVTPCLPLFSVLCLNMY